MTGSFQLAKTVEQCLRKCARETGYPSVLVKTKVFDVKIVERVMTGSHYVISLHGGIMIS